MRDVGNQIVLGTFIARLVYWLLVLRTVRGDGAQEFVPSIAITGGVVWFTRNGHLDKGDTIGKGGVR
jgi:uncharacterized membrane protein